MALNERELAVVVPGGACRLEGARKRKLSIGSGAARYASGLDSG